MLLHYDGPGARLRSRVLIPAACCLLLCGCSAAPQRSTFSSARAGAYAATPVKGQGLATAQVVVPRSLKPAQAAPLSPNKAAGSPTAMAQNVRAIPAPSVTLQVRTSMRGPAMQEAMQAAGFHPGPAPLPPAPLPAAALQPATLQKASYKPMMPALAVLHRPDPASAALADAPINSMADPMADIPLQAVRSAGGSCGLSVYRLAWSSAARSGLDPAIVAAVIEAESRCRADAVSDAGAWGLMQLMPQYGAREANRLVHGRDVAPATEALRDPETNIRLGVAYLAALREHFAYIESESARMLLTIAAYNCGADFIEKRLPADAHAWDTRHMGRWLQSNTPAETRIYVSTVLAKSEHYGAAIVAAASRRTGRELAVSH